MSGGGNITNTEERLGALRIQNSSQGVPIAMLWGRNRLSPNLLWFDDFEAIEHRQEQQSGGKGGGTTMTNVTFTYTASLLMGLCAGPSLGIVTIWRNKDKLVATTKPLAGGGSESLSAMQVAGITQFGAGALGQANWSYLTTAHPAQDIAYSGVSYVAATKFLLGGVAGLPQLGFEVDGMRQMGGGNVDANPADVILDLLTSSTYGANFPAAQMDSLTPYRNWCNAAGLWVSPVWAERKGVFEYVAQLAKLTFSRVLWSVNKIKLVPMTTHGLVSSTGTYAPAPEYSTPVYSLTDDDFLAPVEETRTSPVDRFNRVSIKYRARTIDYAEAIESAEDRASIDAFGLIEAPDVIDAKEVAVGSVAATVAELVLREYMAEGSEYRFTLPISYDLLEPLDIVQIEDARIGLSPRAVRITEITENGDDGSLAVLAQDLIDTGSATQARQAATGYAYDNSPPAAVSVRTAMMPTALTGTQQLWVGVAAGPNWGGSTVWVSYTGTDYVKAADVTARTRLGTLAGSLSSASVELNAAQVLDVNMLGSSTISSASQDDVDSWRSLLWVNGELMSFRDATLTAVARYNLGYLRRMLYGTTAPAHGAGESWMRLDEAIAKIDIPDYYFGGTLYLKVTSKNARGTYIQGLDEVSAITVALTAATSVPGIPASIALTGPFVGTYFDINWGAAPRATGYRVDVFDAAYNLIRSISTAANSYRYTSSDAITDGGTKRNYVLQVAGTNSGGSGPVASLAISNPAPATTVGLAQSGTGTSRTITWTANAATDLAGYLGRYSTTAGFDPAAGQGASFYDGPAATTSLGGLTVGTVYYVRVAAYDVWAKDLSDLNWSTQLSFTA